MTSEPREDLISAYLDGELSAAQRAEVEKSLAESAELRQLYDELRALGGSMQALPRHKLDHDLGPAVLRRAERTVLGASVERPVGEKVEPDGPVRAWWSRGTWHRWAGSAAALAAGLLLLLFDTQEQPAPRQVAKAPQAESFVGAAPDDGAAAKRTEPQAAETSSPSEHEADRAAPSFRQENLGAVKEKTEVQNRPRSSMPSQSGAAGGSAPQTNVPLAKPADSPNSAKARYASPSSAATEKRNASRMILQKNQNQAADESQDAVVCEVTGEFIREAAFEKLLDKRKLNWQRGQTGQLADVPLEQDRKDRAAAPAEPAEPRVDYVVEATPDQVDEIVTDLRKDKSRFKRLANDYSAYQNARAQRNTRQTPELVVFTLQTTPAPAATAAPRAGEDKP